jgi:flagellar hook-associated protein 2
MAAVTTTLGIGSGIDIAGTVSQLAAAESKPQLDAIAAKTNVSQTKLSGLGALKGALSTFQSAVAALDTSNAFRNQRVASSDDKVLKVAIVPGASTESHAIKINTLANPQKSISTVEFKEGDVVSEGILTFNDGAGAPKFSVTVTKGSTDTLTALRDSINNAKNNNNVVASILNVDSKTLPITSVSRLILTSKGAGSANGFTIDASSGDTRFNLDKVKSPANFNTTEATDANIVIDPQPLSATPQRTVTNTEFSSTDVIAPGLISFKDTAGAEKFSVNIVAGTNDKLLSVADAINNASGNTTVVASVINVDSVNTPGTAVSKLVFTAKQAGLDNKFIIDASAGDLRLNFDTIPANAQKSINSTEFVSLTDAITSGDIVFKDATGLPRFTVTVAADSVDPVSGETIKGNNTLAGLRDAINFSSENNKLVIASIVTSDSVVTPGTTVSKLVLTAMSGGPINGFSVDASAGDTRFNFDNAAVVADGATPPPTNYITTVTTSNLTTTQATNAGEGGLSITRKSNTMTDAIPGATLTLVSTGTADVKASFDNSTVAAPITNLVNAYNTLNDTLKQLTSYDSPGSANNGPLLGNTTVQNIISQVKLIMGNRVTSASGSYNSLSQLGFSFDKKGVLNVDSDVLNTALSSDMTSVANIFNSTNGVATQLNVKLKSYLDAKGTLSTQQDSLNAQLKQLTVDKAAVQTRLDASQKALTAQFNAMDAAVSQFKNTGTFLTQAFAPKTTN